MSDAPAARLLPLPPFALPIRKMDSSSHASRTEDRNCPNCGAVLPVAAPPGQCPACLFRIGMALAEGGLDLGDESAIKSGADVQAQSPPPTREIKPENTFNEAGGQTIGRYKLLEKIGEGGCGVVYMAEQEEPVRRRVALKIIKLGMDTKAGHRPVRGRAAGAGDDGPSEHRQGVRCRRHRHRPALLRDGTGARHPDHRVLRPEQACARGNGWSCSSRSARPFSTRIRRASFTATSSPRTSWSPCTTACRCPR